MIIIKRLFIPLIMVSLLSGCWDLKELNEISVITGLAVDKGDEKKYKLTMEGLNPGELGIKVGSGNTPSVAFSMEGDSIAEMAHKANMVFSRRPIYSHMRVVLISEEIAKEGLFEILDFLDRDREIRNNFNLIVVEERPAEEVLRINYPIQKVSTQKIFAQAQAFLEEWGGDPSVRLMDLIDAYGSPGREPVTATLKVKGDSEKGKSVENMQKVTPDAFVELDGLAVFKDNKLVGRLGVEDTAVYLMTQNKLEKTSISVPCSGDKHANFRLRRFKSKIKVFYKNGKPVISIKTSGEGDLEGTECTDPIDKIETLQKYEKMVSKNVANKVKQSISFVQEEYGSDIYGFGDRLYKSNPHQFDRVKDHWNEDFAQAKLQVQVEIQIRRTGLRGKSFLQK
ncbi:Ger(x)C family spore germination protein [Bacillus massilinigeriensis]|uniref:Ger(x)C family spore germination protein n=1 Tax=Bacillus massilionigeriensis TaxID=1805475 RepID=UPI00096AEEED|nr:Ger(x)C family spore germination protein [Bacillus massilionigeriensis]